MSCERLAASVYAFAAFTAPRMVVPTAPTGKSAAQSDRLNDRTSSCLTKQSMIRHRGGLPVPVIIVIVRICLAVLGTATLLVCGCARNIQSQEAVRKGLMEHLSKRAGLDLNSMQIDITSLQFRENEADAVVSFRAKGSKDPAAGMQMRYTLERKGNLWVVKGRSGSGGAGPHGEGMAMPGMPPGHPPAGAGTGGADKK